MLAFGQVGEGTAHASAKGETAVSGFFRPADAEASFGAALFDGRSEGICSPEFAQTAGWEASLQAKGHGIPKLSDWIVGDDLPADIAQLVEQLEGYTELARHLGKLAAGLWQAGAQSQVDLAVRATFASLLSD